MSDLDILCKELNIKIFCLPTHENPIGQSDGWDRDMEAQHWSIKLERYAEDGKRRTLTTFFSQGSAHKRPPSCADVLNCLVNDALSGEMSFKEFCSEFGYDMDSRSAEKIWQNCVEMAPRVRDFLGGKFDAVLECEH